MVFKLIARLGPSNKLTPDYEKKELVCEVRDDITVPELNTFLMDGLGGYEEIVFDISSFKSLELKNVGDDDLELTIGFCVSYFCNVPFSLKSDSPKKSWSIEGGLNEKSSNLVSSFEFVRKLQETPTNILNTEEFVKEAKGFLSSCRDVSVKEIVGNELNKEKLNLISAVGRASCSAPRLLILEYKPNKNSDEFVALVGKGVCYDTGGLNIKTGSYMSTMKFDMSGGAVSVGTIYALSKNSSKRNVVVMVPLVENSVSCNSYRPDDVIVSHSGKSVEIDNTDAEGRLVLADALSYACQKYCPKEILTIATLTGAIGYALGYKYAGVWATSDSQWNGFYESSLKAGDWVWRMPLDDYYLKDLKTSRVADIKNSAKTGAGGASRAACFLKEFVGNVPYIHLDIANVAHNDKTDVSNSPLLRSLYYYLYSDKI